MNTAETDGGVSDNNMEVRLVLGGGGAKGFSHVGIIQAVTEAQLLVRSIVGTSAGAMMGALFARFLLEGKGITRLERQMEAAKNLADLMLTERLSEFIDPGIGITNQCFVKGEAIEDWLHTHLYDPAGRRTHTFGSLDFPLTVTVTDATTGDAFALNRNTSPATAVARAVRASISMQGVFTEVSIDINGRPTPCWDGGATGNCRFDIAIKEEPRLPVIASSLTYRGEPRPVARPNVHALTQLLSVATYTSSILQRQLERVMRDLLSPEEQDRLILVHPPLSGTDTFDFDLPRASKQELFDSARTAAEHEISNWRTKHGHL